MVEKLRVLVRLNSPARVANCNAMSITSLSVPGMTGRFNTGVIYLITRITGRGHGDAQTFESTITCRNSGDKQCDNRSESEP
jgi:hypothetical protein